MGDDYRWKPIEGTWTSRGGFTLGDTKVKLVAKRDALTEVRDPNTGELVDHMWAPDDKEIDLSSCVISVRLLPNPKENQP